MKSRIDQIFTGRVKLMLPDGEPSGIFKSAVDGPQHLGTNGLEGDEQADLRYHGGPEKALHQYPAEHYALLAQEWHEHVQQRHRGAYAGRWLRSGISFRSWRYEQHR